MHNYTQTLMHYNLPANMDQLKTLKTLGRGAVLLYRAETVRCLPIRIYKFSQRANYLYPKVNLPCGKC